MITVILSRMSQCRPHYQNDPNRVYGFPFAGMEVRFTVEGKILRVRDILPAKPEKE